MIKCFFRMCFIFCLVMAGCNSKRENPAPDSSSPPVTPRTEDARNVEPDPTPAQLNVAYQPDTVPDTLSYIKEGQPAAEAHQKYLADSLDFLDFPALPEWEKSAVAGNDSTLFYPEAVLNNTADLENLPEGELIPLGTLLPIREQVENEDQEYYGLFFFQDHYNFFYRTEWQGRSGIIFGADLAGIHQSLKKNQITALYYQNDTSFPDFAPFTGYRLLAPAEKEKIRQDRIALQEVRKKEYHLSVANPDDMIALYKKETGDKQQTLFITTDLFAHGMHLFFNQYLQNIEETFFVPRLIQLIDSYLIVLKAREADASGRYAETLALARTYFEIPRALLSLSPRVEEGEDVHGMPALVYREVDREAVLRSFPDYVGEEVNLILAAAGPDLSPNFQYEEDYSQYKPRGHYTKNGILEAYFRAMMWFGRLHIYISTGRTIPLDRDMSSPPQGSAQELSLRLMPVAGLVTDITREDPKLHTLWRNLFDPITALIGKSDDLSFYDMVPFWESLGIEDFSSWVEDSRNIITALNRAQETLRPPLISGNSVFTAPSGEGKKPPMGWRLFGQRFTYDSAVHQFVSPPRLPSRSIVRGLDIMKAFGSRTADRLLEQSDYPEMEGLEEVLDMLEEEFVRLSPAIWTETYYNRVLYMVKTQAAFEPGSGFFFTETPAWGLKAQLSAHGTWTALRHDTILYVKQVYAEMAGGGDYEPTFRLKPLPQPVHYIEPNLPFFEGALASLTHLKIIAQTFELLDNTFRDRVSSWDRILTRALTIVKQEYADEEVSSEDVAWIKTIPGLLAGLVIPPDAGYDSYSESNDAFKGAIIADVFTNAELGVALEVGIGIPYRLYVALNDAQGGKRIAVGYTFSYYEFLVGQGNRMTNEEWRELVYDSEPDLSENLPFWARGITLPPRN